MMSTTQSSLQDCYFYFYSSCTKGDECPFRHCELALGTETVCSLWREGRCFRSNCKFRHMESRINRSTIPCYWENQPGGCRKPHCVFLHRKSRNGVQVVKDNSGLILPIIDGKISPKQLDVNESSNVACNLSPAEKTIENDVSNPSLVPVPPLVLKFDEGEESDTESVTSTPVKASSADKKAGLTKNNNLLLKASGSPEDKDFGIKTLEQIRMEKIHKESDSYYGAAYTSSPIEVPRLIDQHYPPKSEFLSLPKDLPPLDKSLPAPIIEPKLSGVDEESDLRDRLSIRRNTPTNKVINQATRLNNFKKYNVNQVEVETSNKLDFKIKTLEEIRREKENRLSKSNDGVNNSLGVLTSLKENKPIKNPNVKTFKKLKINRKSRGLHTVPAIQKHEISGVNLMEITVTPLVSNGIKELSPSETPAMKQNKSDSPGKRKSDDDTCDTASKVPRLDVASNNNSIQVNQVNGSCDENGKNYHLQPILQHSTNQSLSIPNGSSATSSIESLTSPNRNQDKIMISQPATDIETNGANVSVAVSSPPSSTLVHTQNEESEHQLAENEHIPNEETKSEKTLNCSTSSPVKSGLCNENVSKEGKENFLDRSMSVDDDLNELLGDTDMNIDEIDVTHSDDILLQIEEFLES